MKKDILSRLASAEECVWINPHLVPYESIAPTLSLAVSDEEIEDARERLVRFAPFFKKRFPETSETDGMITSRLLPITKMNERIFSDFLTRVAGELYLKMDSHLAVAGSVKARGGIYEVLYHAEELAISAGLVKRTDDYSVFDSDEMREFFSHYTVEVGSTGNLGLSIGTMSAAMGFRAVVHMSADAKEWKKELLRSRGVSVIEYDGDYGAAVSAGRARSQSDPSSYFVDDERSKHLFIGYTTAAAELAEQLSENGVKVDGEHPLVVAIPTGVGSAPGGIFYGLKRIFGDAVHCFFAEPVMCPSVTLGMASDRFEKANVRDIGISGATEADGLACASPSPRVTRIMYNLVSGAFTVSEDNFYKYMRMLYESEGIAVEPSGCAGFGAAVGLSRFSEVSEYFDRLGIDGDALSRSTFVVWATGGSLVPSEVFGKYLDRSREI